MKHTIYLITLLLFQLALFGCKNPEPNPELRDPIYADIQNKLKAMEGEVAAESANTKELEEKVALAVPQTGQVKFAQKYYYDSKNKLERLKQKRLFYKLRLESRKAEVEESYLKAFEKDLPWPNPQEVLVYREMESNRTKSRSWSVKKRIEEEAPKAAPVKAGH